MPSKTRSPKDASVIHLFVLVLIVCFSIYTWKICGCLGFSDCYLCRTITPDIFLKPSLTGFETNDFTKLMDLKNFTFLIKNLPCSNSSQLLVLIHSDPCNYEKRLIIRSTWGKVFSDKFKLLFLLGIPKTAVVQKRIDEESSVNGDIVQGNFMDTYRNLTYKHVMGLKWTKYFCPKAKYLLKTDDDVFVNSPSFSLYITQHLPETKLMRCLPIYESRAQRTWRSKWRVTWSEYKFRRYPPYCQGFAILYSSDVVSTLYTKAQRSSFFWIDDVFVTGFLALAANFTPSTFGRFMLEPEDLTRVMREDRESFSYLLGPWNLSVMDIKKLWERAFRAGYVPMVNERSS